MVSFGYPSASRPGSSREASALHGRTVLCCSCGSSVDMCTSLYHPVRPATQYPP